MTKNSIKLYYKHKDNKKSILASVPSTSLKRIKSFGHKRPDGWANMLILGNNLIALKSLLQEHEVTGQVRLVYIDPPFASEREYKSGKLRTSTVSYSFEDERAYEDILIGAEYIEFLRKRLLLLKDILANNGSIYVHIDWKMGHYVKALMDEIFGQKRFINDITRIKCNPKNFGRKGYGNIKDMILFYSKTDRYIWNEPREEMAREDIQRLFPKIDEKGRKYTTTPLHAPGETRNGPTGRPWKGLKPPKGRHWRYSPAELDRLDRLGLIERSSTGNPRKKIYADDVLVKGKKRQDIWEFKDPPYPSYPTEKNLEMLKVIVEASSNVNDIVLDCFTGAGTALIASEELGRRWIGIDNSRLAIETAQKKLQAIRGHSAFAVYKAEQNETRKI